MKTVIRKNSWPSWILAGLFILGSAAFLSSIYIMAKPWDVLSGPQKQTLQKILTHWETWIPVKKAEGTAPLITFEELYQGFGAEEQNFLDRMRAIDPQKSFGFQGGYLGESAKDISFKRIENQK
ncbi:MAG: hypothetical protein HYZ83_04225, partial [Candidatus Omnitrophica bacterium]|nr:hypothetical protein [Candidatus Omnitrophota bacterium]